MHNKRSILLVLCIAISLICLIGTADAAKGGGGCKDRDNDGYFQKAGCETEVDCDDADAAVNPGAVEVCDGIDNNCDGTIDEGCGGCTDNDGDGYGSGPDCLGPDCDDSDAAVNPGADEVCGDDIDNNCDGEVDENCGGCVPTAAKEKGCDCFDNTDNDCDGSIDSLDRDCKRQTCDACFDNDGDGWYDCGGDCNDADPAINPGAPEVCNGIDDNCDDTLPIEEQDIDGDGVSICEGDCDDNDPNRSPNYTEEPFGHPVCNDGIDNDCDDLIDAGDPGCDIPCIDSDGDGFGVNGDSSCTYPGIIDCDDTDPTINPFGIDLCDGIDRDCDGLTINDSDNDGFGVPASPYCTYNIEDCDDTDPTINPFGIDLCDGIDRDCDGQTINDNDNDGFGVPASPYCTYNIEDCDDTDPTINPFGIDLCDGIDRDCDGQTINDSDNDGFGVPASPYCTYNIEDCDDTDPTINPFGIDLCDGIDRDCNGTTINDDDSDGFGVPASPYCTYNIEDCDDTDPLVNPFGFEGPSGDPTCSDTKDNDCDGSTDSADPDCASPFCSDNTDCSSGTDYCEKAVGNCGGQGSCQPRPGTCTTLWAPVCGCDGITYSNDCGAAMAGVNVDYDGECNSCGAPPGDDSNCNGIDEDCDGIPDDDYVPSPTTCGVGECATTGLLECQAGGLVDTCVPLPLQQEGPDGDPTCMDGLDNDCDNTTDGADNDCAPTICDPDGDGYCDCPECIGGDCDDYDPNVYPGAPPICDGKDSNCDGQLDFPTDVDMDDDGVPLCAGDCDDTGPACCDNDGDGYGNLGGTDMCSGGLDVDCNDNNPNVNPGAAEGPSGDPTCFDGIDNDCSGQADAADVAACSLSSCVTKSNPKDGPHVENLMDPGPDGLPYTADDIIHTDNNTLLCGKCHGATLQDPIRDQCERCHASGGVTKTLYPDPWPFGFGSAPNVQMHSSLVVGTKYGNWDMECKTCHNPHLQEQNVKHGTSYGMYIKEYICFDNPVTGLNIEEIIEFTAPSGPGSFSDGPPFNENICEMCHTQTMHHQNDGTAPGGQSHNDGTDCTSCHTHDDGFVPIVECFGPHDTVTDCNMCHVSANFADPIPDSACNQCHTAGGSLKGSYPAAPDVETHTGTTYGAFSIDCVECHTDHCYDNGINLKLVRSTIAGSVVPGSQIDFTSYTGPGSFADGPPFEENICNTCHSQTNHHQSDGIAPGGQDHNTANDCTACHSHLPNGFFPTF